jgi:glycosyltransferase involved in cell wall biosynthesis
MTDLLDAPAAAGDPSRPAAAAANVSVCIMTCNEEANIRACLESVAWSDDVVIIDSFSSDRTVEIARAFGARVFQRAYDNEAGQRTFGIEGITYKNRWVYTPDADEVTPPDLRDEMLAIARDHTRPESAFRIRYKNMFMGRWIKHSSLYPTWITRLVRPDRVRYERDAHSRCLTEGPEGRLEAHFIHYSFNKGMNAWYDKHNRYSSSEARETVVSLREKRVPWRDVLSGVPEVRRRALKELSMRLPFRPAARFLYMYVLRGGFLDGKEGYHYCRLLAAYEYMIVIKTEELRRREEGLPV